MPVTPLHYPFAYLISKSDNRLSLPALVVGAVIPDIEVPLMWIFFSTLPDHLFLHSLVGAITVGTILTIVITRFVYPPIIATVFRVDRSNLDSECRITSWMVVSAFLGVMSHLILDFPMHWYNPILWPWVNPFNVVGPLVVLFQSYFNFWTAYIIASALTHISMIILWIVIIVQLNSKGNLWYRHWVRDS
jgi:hypothetical protein